jgi:hypothetical protein
MGKEIQLPNILEEERMPLVTELLGTGFLA